MSAQLLNGTELAKKIRSQIRRERKKWDVTPGLAVIQVGTDRASTLYIKHKRRDCEKVHFCSEVYQLREDITEQYLITHIHSLNKDDDIHGILVQMPLPDHFDRENIINHIDPTKDADGLTRINLGNIAINKETVTPCTPTGIIKLIESTGEEIAGKHVVCIGRSTLVGKSVGLMLLNRNATVTVCHSRTTDLKQHTLSADILIAAVGKPHFITADMVKPGAIVIDVGINHHKGRAIGDVDFDAVQHVAGYITPVPGGVGPMTRAMLLHNTLQLNIYRLTARNRYVIP